VDQGSDPRPGRIAGLVAEAASQVRFFSRLPLPSLGAFDDPARPPPFARALRMLPFAALLVALPGAVVLALLERTELASPVVAVLAVIAVTLVTGAFHEDGLADVADAFAGGATRERRLEIMKDSRIGAFGGVALVAQFVLRVALLAELVERFEAQAGLLVLAVAPLARVAPLVLMVLLPPARPDGLARAVGRPEPHALALAGALALAIFCAVTPVIVGPAEALAGLAVALAGLAGLAGLARRAIGGHTGDVIGAGALVVEIGLLIGLSM
jgi:adenosylcobinamide-GDP ribazoletransferase